MALASKIAIRRYPSCTEMAGIKPAIKTPSNIVEARRKLRIWGIRTSNTYGTFLLPRVKQPIAGRIEKNNIAITITATAPPNTVNNNDITIGAPIGTKATAS